jgi:hypothetical protein
VDLTTYEETVEDPRLEALQSEWERTTYERSPDDPAVFGMFKNRVAGEIIDSDARLSPEALESK